jgi:uncharacterized protein YegL
MLLIASTIVASSGALSEADETEETRTTPTVMLEGYYIDILDAYAITEVTRVLKNPNDEPMDHTFVFRVPEGALISNFSMIIDDITHYADVLEKEEAEEAYQEAVNSGNSAGLVASKGDEVFEYKVSFAPLEQMTATLRFEQVLLKTNGWHEYTLPFDPEAYGENVGWFEVIADIEAPQDIMDFQAFGYQGDSEEDTGGPSAHWEVRLDDVKPQENVTLRWRTGSSPPAGTMYYGEWDGSGYFLHVFDPDPTIFGEVQLGKDFVFILDRSGSMDGTKFEQSKEALEHIYGTLGGQDRFSLVLFDSGVERYSDDLLSVTDESVDTVVQFIRALFTKGSTDIHSGVISALDIFKADGDAVPVIVLLTDGQANTGLYHRSDFRADVMRQNTVDATFFCIAAGYGADWTFLEALALENHGRAIWVNEDQDMVSSITDFVKGFSNPLVSDLGFDYGPGAFDVYPDSVRAHYDGSEVLVAGRLKDGIDDIPMMLKATTASGDQVIEQSFPIEVMPVHDFVPRFWAFSRIQSLVDQMKYNGTDDATVEEITELAIEFQFVTDYTSLFVELPDELQERFDNSTGQYPGDVGSSEGDVIGLHSLSGTYPPSGLRRTPSSGTPNSAPPTNDASSDQDGSYDAGTPSGSSQTSPNTKATAGRTDDLDNDGLPDIEESYRSGMKQGDQIILPSAPQNTKGTQGATVITEEADGISMGHLVVPLLIVLIPLGTIIVVAVHYYIVGRKRFPKR